MTNPYTARELQHLGIVQLDTDAQQHLGIVQLDTDALDALNPIAVQVSGALDDQLPLAVSTGTRQRIAAVTIASGASESGVITLDPGERIVGLWMPSEWTAANITIQASYDGTNYLPVISYGAAIQMFPSASYFTAIDAVDADKISRLPYVKLVSSTASGTVITAVNQGGARTINVVVVSQ